MISFDDGCFYEDENSWEPKISSALESLDQANAQLIRLDVGVQSSLKWDKELEEAKELVSQGKKILWYLDIGDFSQLPLALKDESFASSISIAVRHFVDHVLSSFENDTMGTLLYQGGVDLYKKGVLQGDYEDDFEAYKKSLKLNKISKVSLHELPQHVLGSVYLRYYAADVFRNFLLGVRALLPSHLPALLFFENNISDMGLSIHLASSERWEGFCVFGKGFAGTCIKYLWNSEGISTKAQIPELTEALLIPPETCVNVEDLQAFYLLADKLLQEKKVLRTIPDPDLIFEWHGLDKLYVASQCIEGEGIRRVQGFIAAGGEVCTFGPSLSLAKESAYA